VWIAFHATPFPPTVPATHQYTAIIRINIADRGNHRVIENLRADQDVPPVRRCTQFCQQTGRFKTQKEIKRMIARILIAT